MVEKRFEKLGMPDIERFENYLPTAFNSELTLLQKVNKIIFDLMETNKLTNEMVDYLNRFIETFDEKLYETLEDVLNVWLEDGRLADIVRVAISEEVIEARTDYLGHTYLNLKERLDSEKADIVEVTTQLAQKTKYLTLEQFGAIGDGIVDDTESFKKFISYLNSLNNYVYDGYTLKDCTNINIVFNGVYAIKESITFPSVYSIILDGLRVKAIEGFVGDVLLNFSGVIINSNIINCDINGNLKTNTVIFSDYNLNNVISNNNIHHFTNYGLKMTKKGHEIKINSNKIYQYTWGEFVNSTPTLSTGVGLLLDRDRHDNRFTDNIICYCNENLIKIDGGTNTFVNNHFYNGSKIDTYLDINGAYNEFNSCYFDGVYINLYPLNNIKNSLFITNKSVDRFITLHSSPSDLWKFNLTSIIGNKFKSLNKIETPFVANGFDILNLKTSIYDNIYDNVTPFSLIPSSTYNPSPFNQFKRSLNDEGYEVVGEVKYMWGSCVAYTQKTLDCSKILNVQLTLKEAKSTIPFVTISANTFTPKGDGDMYYFAVCVI